MDAINYLNAAVAFVTPVSIATAGLVLKSMRDTARWRGEYEANKNKPMEALKEHEQLDQTRFQQVIDRIAQSEDHIIDAFKQRL